MPTPSTVVRPGDRRFPMLCSGLNQRWGSRPDRVVLPTDTAGVVAAVAEAVADGARIAVRGGGTGFREFVDHADARVIIDLAEFTTVRHDRDLGVISVAAGARLGEVYATLARRWGVTLPAGNCLSVGVGGHIPGGGFGLLSRRHGLSVDHLFGVEVVTVNASGRAEAVIATRDPADPRHDLWWAHTGGGGGGLGVITRFLLRSPGRAADTAPEELLPPMPAGVLVSNIFIPWSTVDETSFATVVTNYLRWYREHAAPDSPGTDLAGYLILSHRSSGSISLLTHHYGDDERRARAELDAYLAAILCDTGLRPAEARPYTHPVRARRMPYQRALTLLSTGSVAMNDPCLRGEYKSAYLRAEPSARFFEALYRHLSTADQPNPNAMVMLLPYGGRVNAVEPGATASAHRDSCAKLLVQTLWADPEHDDQQIGWARALYADLFADTGGVPVPNDITDGCYINYPDTDLGDPGFNRSGVDWARLYFKDNLPRLRRAARRFDPLDVFRHAQSIPPADRSGV